MVYVKSLKDMKINASVLSSGVRYNSCYSVNKDAIMDCIYHKYKKNGDCRFRYVSDEDLEAETLTFILSKDCFTIVNNPREDFQNKINNSSFKNNTISVSPLIIK